MVTAPPPVLGPFSPLPHTKPSPPRRVDALVVLTTIAVAASVLLTGAAFWLSYEHLHDVASSHGLSGSRAWAWPATVDLFVLIGEVLILIAALRQTVDPWAILLTVAGSGGSIVLNVAGVGDDAAPMDYVVAAVPPIAALLAFGALMRQLHAALAARMNHVPEPAAEPAPRAPEPPQVPAAEPTPQAAAEPAAEPEVQAPPEPPARAPRTTKRRTRRTTTRNHTAPTETPKQAAPEAGEVPSPADQVRQVLNLINEHGYDDVKLGFVMNRTGMSKTTAYNRLVEARAAWSENQS